MRGVIKRLEGWLFGVEPPQEEEETPLEKAKSRPSHKDNFPGRRARRRKNKAARRSRKRNRVR